MEEWQAFEEKVAAILRSRGASVRANCNLGGNQIDVLASFSVLGTPVVFAVECKCWGRRIGKDEVNDFALTVAKLRMDGVVDRGILVSASGFAKDAWLAASASLVELRTLEDLEPYLSAVTSQPSNELNASGSASGEPCVLLPIPAVDSSAIARDKTELLAAELRRGQRRLVLTGPAGVGKSRVVAGLFDGDPALPRMLWFYGSSPDALGESAGELDGGQSPCIVFDECHQEGRDLPFFRSLLHSAQFRVAARQARVLFALRRSSYDQLREDLDEFVVLDHQGVRPETLDQHEAWGLDRPLRPGEKGWIARTAVTPGADSMLLLPILVYACLRWLGDGRELASAEVAMDEPLLDTIYNLVFGSRSCSERDRRVVAALALALRQCSIAPLYLVAAVLRACGTDIGPPEVAARLRALRADGLVNEVPVLPLLGFAGWTFSHDLYYESVAVRAHTQPGGWQPRQEQALLAAIAEIPSVIEPTDTGLDEYAMAYAALVAWHMDGLPMAADAVIALGKRGLNEGRVNRSWYIRVLARLVRWLELLTEQRRSAAVSRSVYDACSRLAAAISDHVALPDALGVERGVAPVMGVAHVLYRLAVEAGIEQERSLSEPVEARFPAIRRIGQRCLEGGQGLPPDQAGNLYQTIRYAQLLMWAGSFAEAADVCWEHLTRRWASGIGDRTEVLRLVDVAAVSDLEAGNAGRAAERYRQAAAMVASTGGIGPLRALFEEHAATIVGLTAGGEAADWEALMRSQACALQEWSATLQAGERPVAVIASHSEMPAASLIASVLAERGTTVRLVYNHSLARAGGLQALPESAAVIVLGGHLVAFFSSLIRPAVSEDQFAEMLFACHREPRYSRIQFSSGGRPGLWVAGFYPWQTHQATLSLIAEEAYTCILP